MRTSLIFIFLISSLSLMASEFKFNNKNLNSLGALICQTQTPLNSKYTVAHKVNINKYRNSDKKNDFKFDIIGTCDIKFDSKKNKIISIGDEFQFTVNTKSHNQIEGRFGIKKIFFNFRKNSLHSLVIIDPLLQTTERIYLSKSKWAINDAIFNFNKKYVELRLEKKTAAVEKNSNLIFNDKNKTTFYNLWSFESFGCSSSLNNKNLEQCQDVVSRIN